MRSSGLRRLKQLQKQWRREALAARLLWGLGLALAFTAVLRWQSLPLVFGPLLFMILFPLLLLADRRWRVPAPQLARHLNTAYPSLEESTQLLLQPALSPLQQLQQQRVDATLQKLSVRSPFRKGLYRAGGFLLLVLLTAFLVQPSLRRPGPGGGYDTRTNTGGITEKRLAAIRQVLLTVTPPAYTGEPARSQQQFALRAEAGAQVSWQLRLNAPADGVQLLFNDGITVALRSADGKAWQGARTVKQSGYYQVRIDGRLSELYPVETLKDAPPRISVQSPQPTLSLAYGGEQKVLVRAKVSDDHGLSRLLLSATIASGQGEAVKFRDQQFPLPLQGGAKEQSVSKWLDGRSLRMQPGDELYLWLAATDNFGQETRSDVFIVSLEDTTAQLTIDGLLTGLDVKPELFRSQRQIIIETEQLLRSQPRITASAFREKSNDLGTDQKLLRLRYGKFLGEEFSSEIGGDGHADESHNEEKNEAEALLELYGHNHDKAEDASFFDPATKRQLKAMLNEMWNAELKLRTFLPREALAYEYKALRLLKDLQQKSRAYLPKTSFTPTPLQPAKRLTGNLETIRNGLRRQTVQEDDPSLVLRRAIGELEMLKATGVLHAGARAVLLSAYPPLSARAAQQPSLYLRALSGFKNVLDDRFRLNDIRAAQQGLQQLLPSPPPLPHAARQGRSDLSRAYLEGLKKTAY